ncbi:MAG: ADP-ribosylation factor-like protein [Candidatus Hodarchaeales archaeon]|jgi:GTPase SAR1 family protein
MKISLVGLSGCGKTSIYSTTLGGMAPIEVKDLGPTVMYEVKSHNYLGLQISLWDFGGQEKYRQSYLETPKILANTTILIFVLDLHRPEDFGEADSYFSEVYSAIKDHGGDPLIKIFYHKYDAEDYSEEHLEENLSKAKELPFILEMKPDSFVTSIFNQEELSEVFRQILISDFEKLKESVENAQKHLMKLKSRIIVSDVNGNVITHSIKGFSTGIQLREDLRDYILACNVLRENFLTTESASFTARSEKKKLRLHIFSYVLTVLIMVDEDKPADPPEAIDELLNEMEIFAELIIDASKEED